MDAGEQLLVADDGALMRPRIQVIRGVLMTTSLAIAGHFEKEHRDVLRAIRNEIADHADRGFTEQHFFEAVQVNTRGRPTPIFRLTEIGFSLIAMGFTGAKAKRWQRAYAQTFAAMRQDLLDAGNTRTRQLFEESTTWRSKAMLAELETRTLIQANAALHEQMQQRRREIGVLRTSQQRADELLAHEYGTEAAQAVIELKGMLSEVVIDAILAEERHAQALEQARRANAHPDLERFCASEIFVHLVAAMKYRLYSALLLWALMHARAFDAPVRVASRYTDGQTVLQPRAVCMRTLAGLLGDGVFRNTLQQAASRLEAEGLVVKTQCKSSYSRRTVWHYQARLQPLIRHLECADRSALISRAGTRSDLVLSDGDGTENGPLLLDEYEGLVGSRAIGFARRERREDGHS